MKKTKKFDQKCKQKKESVLSLIHSPKSKKEVEELFELQEEKLNLDKELYELYAILQFRQGRDEGMREVLTEMRKCLDKKLPEKRKLSLKKILFGW